MTASQNVSRCINKSSLHATYSKYNGILELTDHLTIIHVRSPTARRLNPANTRKTPIVQDNESVQPICTSIFQSHVMLNFYPCLCLRSGRFQNSFLKECLLITATYLTNHAFLRLTTLTLLAEPGRRVATSWSLRSSYHGRNKIYLL